MAIATCGALWLCSRVSPDMGEDTSSITHALTDYNPLERDALTQIRPPRRPGAAAYEADFSSARRDYDPLTRN